MCEECGRPYLSCECETAAYLEEDEQELEEHNEPSEL
jgi:hypothetical protein